MHGLSQLAKFFVTKFFVTKFFVRPVFQASPQTALLRG
jgi:hypothetical protein